MNFDIQINDRGQITILKEGEKQISKGEYVTLEQLKEEIGKDPGSLRSSSMFS